mgnify:CR=1 FL=1
MHLSLFRLHIIYIDDIHRVLVFLSGTGTLRFFTVHFIFVVFWITIDDRVEGRANRFHLDGVNVLGRLTVSDLVLWNFSGNLFAWKWSEHAVI